MDSISFLCSVACLSRCSLAYFLSSLTLSFCMSSPSLNSLRNIWNTSYSIMRIILPLTLSFCMSSPSLNSLRNIWNTESQQFMTNPFPVLLFVSVLGYFQGIYMYIAVSKRMMRNQMQDIELFFKMSCPGAKHAHSWTLSNKYTYLSNLSLLLQLN